jgi:FkbM family methyltransferase
MRKIKKFLKGFRAKYFPGKKKIIYDTLLGTELLCVEGSVRRPEERDDVWYRLIAENVSSVFDIGCNTGHTAMILKIANRQCRCLFVDANPAALEVCSKNLLLNNWMVNTSFYNAFVSAKSGEQISFFSVGTDAAASMFRSHAESAGAVGAQQIVPTISIDDLVSYLGWKPDFVKIDVEGAEVYALAGATLLAAEGHTIFMVEMHNSFESPLLENTAKVLEWCEKFQYSTWLLRYKKKISFPEEVKGAGKPHFLLLPNGVDFPSYLV